MIRTIVRATAPALVARPGIGIHSAAQLLLTAGGNPERLRNDAAFAALCGVSPVQASSGQTHRHQLSRGGDRAANNALWTIANNRLIHDNRTREYAARRKTTGDSRNDTLRVLKRYIARETFTIIRDALHHHNAFPRPLDIGASTPSPRPWSGLFKHECVRADSPFRRGPLDRLSDLEMITADWVRSPTKEKTEVAGPQ